MEYTAEKTNIVSMLEENFNTIVSHSLDFGYKIADTFSSAGTRSKSPFDGFGIHKGHLVVWESKWLKTPKAFQFSRLQDHQIENLLRFSKVENCVALFLIGVDFGRGDKRVFYWTDMDYIDERKRSSQSILKKEFLSLTNFVKIKKDRIDFDFILEGKS